jgi:hypothetical protein
MITFAAFYVDVTAETMDNIHKRTAGITVIDPHRFTETMFASAAHFHPGCRKVLLTDAHTALPFAGDIEVIRLDLDPRQPMLARSTAWLTFLQQADAHVVFLDSDILINANLDHVFAPDFDIALTYRAQAKWPINAGINFAHGQRLERARAFHQMWLDQFQARYPHEAVWGGDQDVLEELVSTADFSRSDTFRHQQHGFELLLLPCALYNFATEDQHGMTGHYPDKKVLHFKGRRKPHMFPYWQQYIKPAT